MNSIIYDTNKAHYNFNANINILKEQGYNVLNDNR